ncbi:WDSUB1 [Symbiodinium natans]|uniref:WDSUB1 protein n=1 Tax=Symbiodinium natans TaxID=878477 RepID=A0A812V534_9DINO|nr:WDSUB1 [Symbiodinium natans]
MPVSVPSATKTPIQGVALGDFADSVSFEYGEEKLGEQHYDREALAKLPARIWIPELGEMPCERVTGFQMVRVINSELVKQLVLLVLFLDAEGRRRYQFGENHLATQLLSEEQRKKVNFIGGPVVTLKNTRFSVLKCDNPMDLSLADLHRWTKAVPNFYVPGRPAPTSRPLRQGPSPFQTQGGLAKPAGARMDPRQLASPASFPSLPKPKAKPVDPLPKPRAAPRTQCPPQSPPGLKLQLEDQEDQQLGHLSSGLSMAATASAPSVTSDFEVSSVSAASECPPSPACSSKAPETLQNSAETATFQESTPADWSVERVASWLASLDNAAGTWDRYVDSFRENQISGKALRSLTMEELRDDLDIKAFGPRKVIMAEIQKLFATRQ